MSADPVVSPAPTGGEETQSKPVSEASWSGQMGDCEALTTDPHTRIPKQGSSSLVGSARADHRVALKRCTVALIDRKLPVPAVLRDEPRLASGVVW